MGRNERATTEKLEVAVLKGGVVAGIRRPPCKSERDPEANLLLSARVTSVPGVLFLLLFVLVSLGDCPAEPKMRWRYHETRPIVKS